MLDLRHLEMTYGFILYVVHIAGTRMIMSGIDGLSRGDLDKGLMGGASPLEFVALHLLATVRSPKLTERLRTWMPSGTNFLSPEGWFRQGHKKRPWIWALAPAAVDISLDQLCIACHKDSYVFHVVVVPWPFTPRWRKQLMKIADYVFNFPLSFPL